MTGCNNAYLAAIEESILDMVTKSSEYNLAHEISLLRKEIAALREELSQSPSQHILTGKHVVDEYLDLLRATP